MEDESGGGSFDQAPAPPTANRTPATWFVDRSQEGDDSLDGDGLDNIIVSDSSNNAAEWLTKATTFCSATSATTRSTAAPAGTGLSAATATTSPSVERATTWSTSAKATRTARYTSALEREGVRSLGSTPSAARAIRDFIDLNQLVRQQMAIRTKPPETLGINVQVVGSDTDGYRVDATGDWVLGAE